jgi:hypothetical protein
LAIFTDDGASHTIDTTGSSSLGWRSGAVTLANAGTTLKVGLAAVDTTNGPPTRAVNVADVITFDVSKSYTSAAAPTATAWIESVPGAGTKTIANGDLVAFCVQMTARGGADAVNVQTEQVLGGTARPAVTDFTGAAYSNKGNLPNAVITFSDGVLGYFYGGYVASVGLTSQAWNNTSGTKEYGNLLQFPFPCKAYGIFGAMSFNGDTDLILYSDPLGTPFAEKTISVDLNTIGAAASNNGFDELFPAPFSIAANTPYAVIAKPTSATNVTLNYKTFNAAAHQKSESPGSATNGYAVNRASGAFGAQNSSKDRFAIGLLLGAFDAGGGPVGQQCM